MKPEMKDTKVSKKNSEKICRTFSLMFNRTSMYKLDHPFAIQSIDQAYKAIQVGLNEFSPVVLTFNRDQFFIEDEPFDHRLNTSRMAAHFKKIGIQSISFEKGVAKTEVVEFVKIFTDSKTFATAVSMKDALSMKRVTNLKINHFIYKKVTTDDEIISKDKLKEISTDPRDSSSKKMLGDVVNMMAESILMEEVEKSISLDALLADPAKLSKDMIDKDFALANNNQSEMHNIGTHIAEQLDLFKDEVQNITENANNLSLSKLADAVFDLKKQLIKGIESQKELGINYENELQIIDEANALTDQVLIQLLKDEYKKGDISIQRLAQIIGRLIPEPKELRRLIPKLRESLIEEGMPKSDFFQLLQEIENELQTENLVGYLEKGAEDIGITSEELINEFKNDPSSAAELIYLASKIRKGTGDEDVLTDLLVEYIERIGSKIVLDDVNPNEQKEGDDLKKIIADVESEIVKKLEKKGIEPDVLQAVQQRLIERMESSFNEITESRELRQDTSPQAGEIGKTTIFTMLEESVNEGEELHKILKQARSSIGERGIDENNFQQLYSEIQRLMELQEKSETKLENGEKKALPNGILSYNQTLLFIEKEISRSLRYETPFSIITFSVQKIIPKQPIPSGSIKGHLVNNLIMAELVNILRDADLVGILTKKILTVLLPMTENQNAKIAMSRLLKGLQTKSFLISGYSFSVSFAGVVTSFDVDRTPDLISFMRIAENEHSDFLVRLKNIQDLY